MFVILSVLNLQFARLMISCLFVEFKDQIYVKNDVIDDICNELADLQEYLAVEKVDDKIILDKIEVMNEGSDYHLLVLFPYHVFPNLAIDKLVEFAEYDKITLEDKLSILKTLVTNMIKRAKSQIKNSISKSKDPKVLDKLLKLQAKIANFSTYNLEVEYCDSDIEIDEYEYSSETDDEIYVKEKDEIYVKEEDEIYVKDEDEIYVKDEDEIYVKEEDDSVVFNNYIPGRKRRMIRPVNRNEETPTKKLKIYYS